MVSRRLVVRLLVSAIPCLFFLGAAFSWWQPEFLSRVENYLYDLRVRLTAPGGVDQRVVIVDIDEKSLAAEGQWPWPRDKLARLLDQLFDHYEIRVLGFDVVFPEPEEASALRLIADLERTPLASDKSIRALLQEKKEAYAADQRFAEALVARDIVMGYLFRPRILPGDRVAIGALPPPVSLDGEVARRFTWRKAAGYTANLPELQQAALAGGFFDTPLTDEGGVVRRAPLLQEFGGQLYESLALAVARISIGSPPLEFAFDPEHPERLSYLQLGDARIPVDTGGVVYLPFRGGVSSFPYLSAARVLHGTASPEILKGAIVLIGASAPGLLDIRPTPVAKEYIGVEAHANLVVGLLDGTIRSRPFTAPWIEAAVLVVLAVLTGLWLPRLSPLTAATLVLLLGSAVVALNLAFWSRAGQVLSLAAPLIFLAVAGFLQLTYGYFVESRRKRRLSRLFGQYVPPEVVQELDAGETEISLEGESREMTVLFSDVRGFTTLSEGLKPTELTQLMNEFLTPITAVIQQHRGTIDKYMGDAVMAFWGAPLADPAHARHAIQAGLSMVEAVEALADPFRARGWPPIHIGVGLSTGPMNVGNMGSSFRMAYTVLGDTVNLGSRLEGLTKQYGVTIIVSAATRAAVPDMAFRELDRVRVKGKLEPVAIYEPLGERDALDPKVLADVDAFTEVLEHYRCQRWDEAEAGIAALAERVPLRIYAIYRERIAHFRAHPPGEAWDGVFTHESK